VVLVFVEWAIENAETPVGTPWKTATQIGWPTVLSRPSMNAYGRQLSIYGIIPKPKGPTRRCWSPQDLLARSKVLLRTPSSSIEIEGAKKVLRCPFGPFPKTYLRNLSQHAETGCFVLTFIAISAGIVMLGHW